MAWDDGAVYQGFLGSVQSGSGIITTGCISWRDTSQLIRIKCCPGEVPPQK